MHKSFWSLQQRYCCLHKTTFYFLATLALGAGMSVSDICQISQQLWNGVLLNLAQIYPRQDTFLRLCDPLTYYPNLVTIG